MFYQTGCVSKEKEKKKKEKEKEKKDEHNSLVVDRSCTTQCSQVDIHRVCLD